MQITTTQTEAEFARNSLRVFYNQLAGKVTVLLGFWMLGWFVYQLFNRAPDAGFPVLPALVGLAMLFLVPALVYRRARAAYAATPSLREPVTYIFKPEFIGFLGHDYDGKVSWDKVHSVTEKEDAVIIFVTKQLANTIPKRNFSPAELAEFRKIVADVAGPRVRLLG